MGSSLGASQSENKICNADYQLIATKELQVSDDRVFRRLFEPAARETFEEEVAMWSIFRSVAEQVAEGYLADLGVAVAQKWQELVGEMDDRLRARSALPP